MSYDWIGQIEICPCLATLTTFPVALFRSSNEQTESGRERERVLAGERVSFCLSVGAAVTGSLRLTSNSRDRLYLTNSRVSTSATYKVISRNKFIIVLDRHKEISLLYHSLLLLSKTLPIQAVEIKILCIATYILRNII